ncbi:contractile tail sheath structural protein [Bacillus phage vB_BpuM-BpSp]|nr:contractile tail sheath structural protein [Bacillus phage vB_BpuM-BpSp]
MANEVTSGNTDTSVSNDLKYLHPSISSTIRSDDIIFEAGDNVQRLFAAYTSEKGEDNKVKMYSSEEEFIYYNGEPDIKKYGQTSYNIINWLRSGGVVYGMRVLPENAGYAHAFLNILTRIDSKDVADKDGQLVKVPNVILKPAIAYTDVNNTSKSLIEYELKRERKEETIDGFKNHLIFAVYPKGRGSSYNNIGFRITLNTSFDETHDFRVYNFEVIQFDENNVANTVEGPFYVSLDSDALSSSNESMFIEDVINKYSKHLNCIFNQDAFDDLCDIINPHIPSSRIDPFTGVTKVTNDVKSTFFLNSTQKYEDDHITIHKYDIKGEEVLESNGDNIINIVDPTDVIEQSILMADNVYRERRFKQYVNSIDDMKKVAESVRLGNYNTIINNLLYSEDGTKPDSGKIVEMLEKLEVYRNNIENYVEIFNTSLLESDFKKITTENTLVEKGIADTMTLINQLLSYHKALESTSDVLGVEEKVNQVVNRLNLKEVIDIRSISKRDALNSISNTILELKASGNLDDQLEGLIDIISEVKIVIDYLLLIVSENNLSPTAINKAVDNYNVIIDYYKAITDPYISLEAATSLLAKAYSELDLLVSELYNITELAIVNIDLLIIDDVITKKITSVVADLVPITYNNIRIYAEKIATSDGLDELNANIRKNIANADSVATTLKSIVYTNQLQNLSNPARFLYGTDGDLETANSSNARVKVETRLLARAYSGSIDPTVADRKTLPFRFILDANYPVEVKNAIVSLARDIRRDFFFYSDTGIRSTEEDTLNWKTASFNPSTELTGMFAQNYIVYDEFTGRDIQVTLPFFLAKMVVQNAEQNGVHYPLAGSRRGVIDGYKAINFIPNEIYKEEFYKKKINYVENNGKVTRIGSQRTSQSKNDPLSDINNVLTVLNIKRDVEEVADDYLFEFNDDETQQSFQYNLNDYLQKYISNRSCQDITASVYASEYDKQQHILRVNITVQFNNVIERISFTIDVKK